MGGEFDRIGALAGIHRAPAHPMVGIGDDAAVVRMGGVDVAWTVDASVEGVHFDRRWLDWESVAARAVEAAVSDLAAMGARTGAGSGLLLAVTLPDDADDALARSLSAGAERAARRLDTYVLGGNYTRGPVVSLATTALGPCVRAPVLRSGAKIGDGVWLSGPVGAAALGLAALIAGRADEPGWQSWTDAWRTPRARVDLSETVALLAHAAIDVSDGLVQDASHLSAASGCAVRIDVVAVPRRDGHAAAARSLGLDPRGSLLAGGEDYELLVTAPERASAGLAATGFTRIGTVEAGSGVWFVNDDDGPATRWRGWDHAR